MRQLWAPQTGSPVSSGALLQLACQLGSDGELCTRIITRRGAGEGISLDLISSFPLDRSLTKATSKISESALISLKLLSPSCSGTRTPAPSTQGIFNFLAFSQQKSPKMCICWDVSQQKQQFGSRQTKPAVHHTRVSILCSFNLCLCFCESLPALLSVIFTFKHEDNASRKLFISEVKWKKHI